MIMNDTQASFPSVTLSGTIIPFRYVAQDMSTIINNQKKKNNKQKTNTSMTLHG